MVSLLKFEIYYYLSGKIWNNVFVRYVLISTVIRWLKNF